MKNKKSTSLEIGKGLALVTQVGITILVPMLLCIWGASFLVRRFNFSNGFIVVGTIVGVAAGMVSVYRFFQGYMKNPPSAHNKPRLEDDLKSNKEEDS